MYKEFLKKELLEKRYGVYAKILEVYHEQMQLLKTASCFRRWLAEELEMPIGKIELSSLDSAFQRRKKKNTSTVQNKNCSVKNDDINKQQANKFTFTKLKSEDAKSSSIVEM